MSAAIITSPYMGGERLPMFFPSFGFEAVTWPRILTVLVRGLTWCSKAQQAGVAATVAKTSLYGGIA